MVQEELLRRDKFSVDFSDLIFVPIEKNRPYPKYHSTPGWRLKIESDQKKSISSLSETIHDQFF